MNFFLQVNRKIIIILISFFLVLSFAVYKINLNKFKNTNSEKIEELSTNDIINPKFTLNNKKQIIEVTANEGNFLTNTLILLKNNVKFSSSRFKIFSTEVLFDNKEQTAESKKQSKFISENTEINAQGFNISENGNKITFNGKTKVSLKKWNIFL